MHKKKRKKKHTESDATNQTPLLVAEETETPSSQGNSKWGAVTFLNNPTLICGLLGALSFLIIYGTIPLRVTFDLWIMDGFVEADVLQHYAGWLFFRNSPWTFPLGLATELTYPAGMVITFTDSIPVVSIFFKLLSPILPETFQFFGIYVLACFVLQGVSSAKLLSLFTEKKHIIILGAALFCFSPIMIERAFRHVALASHFLIIFSLYLYFKSRKSETPKIPWAFIILNVLSIGIHPYFLPIVFGMTAITAIEYLIKSKKLILTGCFLAANVVSVLLFGYIIGLFGMGADGGIGGFTYSYFSMNLNAIYNPFAIGGWEWSRLFRVRPQTRGNFDGFNYLGAGVILMIFFMAAYLFTKYLDDKSMINKQVIKDLLKRNIFLILFCTGMTLFAISNVVTFNESILFVYPLPGFFLDFAEIFRASSRMFYITFYVIFLCVVLLIALHFNHKKSWFLISLLLVIQLFDISPAFVGRHQHFASYSEYVNAEPIADDLDNILNQFDYFIFVEHEMKRALAIQLAKNQMITNGNIANRAVDGRQYRAERFREEWYSNLTSGNPNPQHIYSFGDANNFLVQYYINRGKVYPVEINDLRLLIPIRENLYIPSEFIVTPEVTLDFFFTDEHWERGLSRHFAGFFVPNLELYRDLYRAGVQIEIAENDIRQITHVEEHGTYLHVHLDGEQFDIYATDYPLNLRIIEAD